MIYEEKTAKDIRIAYIGGGSLGWAWTLMRDLERAPDLSGTVRLYDIDEQAAIENAAIGNTLDTSHWNYVVKSSLGDALTGADFVIISILPGTFDEMEYDVHTPEKYGIYQSVGDTTGPGGFIRALRTVPMFEEIALAIKEYSPDAWVINYTNPMAICVKALYEAFPEIKAFGCCHEVFGTQNLLCSALEDMLGIKDVKRQELFTEVVGVNHFTWFTKAKYRDIDLIDLYDKFSKKYYETGFEAEGEKGHWMNSTFKSAKRVTFDLFRRFGYIGAAGDRHLAEFMPAEDYLASPEQVTEWKFGLTTVEWRKNNREVRLKRRADLLSGAEKLVPKDSGEEGVDLMRALIGLKPLVTNVNIPNRGQIDNLPIGAVVETNAVFSADTLSPVYAGKIPESILPLIARVSEENDDAVEAAVSRSREKALAAFKKGHLLDKLSDSDKEAMFNEMFDATKEYLKMYK